MSQDHMASEPLCEMTVPTKEILGVLTVQPAPDGGYVVGELFCGSTRVLFAAGTIQEACEYLEDRFS